jgi:uncharacterized protein involved in exopolysaccharide biosynthesis
MLHSVTFNMGSKVRSDDDGEVATPAGDAGLDARLDRAVPESEAAAFLIAVAGGQPGRVYPLARNTILLGRNDSAGIAISDPSVSGEHARIINGSQGLEIEDLGSTNGTFVGGQRITRARLRNGDRVVLGSVEFSFLNDRPVEATVALLAPGQWRSTSMPSASMPNASMPNALMRFPEQRYVPRSSARREAEEDDSGPSLTEFVQRVVGAFRFLRRYARLIAVMAVIGTGVGLISIFALPPAAAAVCEVKLQPQMKSNPVEAERPSEDSLQFFTSPEHAFVNSELVRSTLRQLDGVEPDDARLSSIGGHLKFESLDEPHLYRASYRESLGSTGQLSPVQLLTAHLNNYVQSEIGKALKVFTAEAEFLRGQMKVVETDLSQIGAERTKFRQANADRLPEEAVQTHSSRFQLESRRAELLAQVRRLQGELESGRRQLASEGPLSQTKYQSSQVYRQSLASVNQKLSEAYARGLADGHPEVKQLHDEKQRIEGLIEGEMRADTTQVDRQSNGGLQALQNRVEATQGQLSAVRSDLADTEKNLGQVRHLVGDLPRVEERVQEMSHKQDATNRLHTQLFEKLKKAELQLNLERVSAESRYEMVKPPRLEKSGKVKIMAIRCGLGLFVGLFVAALAIALREVGKIVSQTLETLDSRSGPSWR